MKKLFLPVLLVSSGFVFSQNQIVEYNKKGKTNDAILMSNTPTIIVEEFESEKIVVSTNSSNLSGIQTTEEETLNPLNTGHTKSIVNGKEFYHKTNETITIINNPN